MARQALQALDKILQAQSQRKKADVQESLAFMQFAMQKRASDIKEFGLTIDVLEKANAQAKVNTANDFIQHSGLNNIMPMIPTTIEDPDKRESGLEDVSDMLREKKYGDFNKQNADIIATALWEYKNTQDPRTIIGLANQIKTTLSTKPTEDTPPASTNLINALSRIGDLENLQKTVLSAEKLKQNDRKILKEKFDFASGDTKIQTGIGMFSKEVEDEYKKQKPTDPYVTSMTDNVEGYLSQEERTEKDDSGIDIGTGIAATGIGGALVAGMNEAQTAKAVREFNNQVSENIKTKIRNDSSMMSSKEFGEKYKYKDSKGNMVKMTKKFAKSPAGKKELARQALEFGRSQTSLAKGIESVKAPFKWAKDLNIDWKNPIAKNVTTFGAPIVLPAIGQAVGGDIGGAVGTTIGSGMLVNHVVKKGTAQATGKLMGRTFTNFLASRIPKIAAKAGIVAMSDSPMIPVMDLVALGLTINEISSVYKEWTQLYDDGKLW